jgi:hypothetical protein
MDQAAKGLASQDRGAAAAGLQNMADALRRAAKQGKGKIKTLGKMDQEFARALDDLRKKKGRRGRAGDGDARAGGRSDRAGKGPRPGTRGGQGAAGATGKPGSGPADVQRKPANRRVGIDPSKRRPRRPASSGARAGGKGRGGVMDGDERNTRAGGQGGSLVRRGPPPTVPFTPAQEDPGLAYRREVGEYLARENVPREYQEMIRQYFER